MFKKIVSIIAVSLMSLFAFSFVGCSDSEAFDYTYEFTAEGFEVNFNANSLFFEIKKGEELVGLISTSGQIIDGKLCIPAKCENYTLRVNLNAKYDRAKVKLTSSNAEVKKTVIVGEEDDSVVSSTNPDFQAPTTNEYWLAVSYAFSKDSKENIKFNLSGLTEFDAMDYNWELDAIGTEIDGVEYISTKGQSASFGDKDVVIGTDFLLNLNLKGESKSFYQKFGNEDGTTPITCSFDNGIYSFSFSDQVLKATLVYADANASLTDKRYLKLDIGENKFAYMLIKNEI